MGLDVVEMVMNVEDEFDVVIQLDDYGELRTVGDLSAYISQQRQVETSCLHPAAFVRIRQALMNELGLSRKQIRPEADLDELFPVCQRRRQWASFESVLGLRIPALRPSPDQRAFALAGMVCVTVASALLAFLHPVFLLSIVLTPIFGILALALINTRFARSFSMHPTTVGGLTRSVASLNAMLLRDDIHGTGVRDPGIWLRLRRVVSQSLGIPEAEIHPESRFVEDLLA